eukprot:2900825-Pleurochrysis_carterae.AAC.5
MTHIGHAASVATYLGVQHIVTRRAALRPMSRQRLQHTLWLLIRFLSVSFARSAPSQIDTRSLEHPRSSTTERSDNHSSTPERSGTSNHESSSNGFLISRQDASGGATDNLFANASFVNTATVASRSINSKGKVANKSAAAIVAAATFATAITAVTAVTATITANAPEDAASTASATRRELQRSFTVDWEQPLAPKPSSHTIACCAAVESGMPSTSFTPKVLAECCPPHVLECLPEGACPDGACRSYGWAPHFETQMYEMQNCRQLCAEFRECAGFEFRASRQNCEFHLEKPSYIKASPTSWGVSCWAKKAWPSWPHDPMLSGRVVTWVPPPSGHSDGACRISMLASMRVRVRMRMPDADDAGAGADADAGFDAGADAGAGADADADVDAGADADADADVDAD